MLEILCEIIYINLYQTCKNLEGCRMISGKEAVSLLRDDFLHEL